MNNINPRFQTIEEKFGSHSAFKLTDILTGEYIRILPYLGGTINDIYLRKDDRLFSILKGYSTSEEAEKNIRSSFKGSHLFPFPNRVKDGKYSHNGKKYQLEINFPQENNAIHGLIYNQEFKVIGGKDGHDKCSLTLLYSPKELPDGYPFNYSIEVEYLWLKNSLFECNSKVTNLCSEEIPFGIGWHPYFVAGEANADDLWIQFPSERILKIDKRMIPTGANNAYSDFNKLTRVGKTKFDDCFVLKNDSALAETIIFNKKENFAYKIWQEVGEGKFNFLQVYTPSTRDSIAFEPMTCAPDALNNKQGLIKLAPGKSISLKWGVSTVPSMLTGHSEQFAEIASSETNKT
jgi:aldose 1-epimerase